MSNHKDYGLIYMSVTQIEGFIKKQVRDDVASKLNQDITDDMFNELEPNFNYLDYVPFNYVMVSLKNKAHEAMVKRNIYDNIDNAMTVISIEDTTSYSMYHGEIDEGEAYVGIFSGLFLFIALLSVITTMRRVVMAQRGQIGTLKVLGFDNKRIRQIFMIQNSWICIVAIIIGLPLGYSLTSYLFKACLDENYDFGVHIQFWTYIVASVGTYLVSYVVSRYLTKRVENIDMVSSLKANE